MSYNPIICKRKVRWHPGVFMFDPKAMKKMVLFHSPPWCMDFLTSAPVRWMEQSDGWNSLDYMYHCWAYSSVCIWNTGWDTQATVPPILSPPVLLHDGLLCFAFCRSICLAGFVGARCIPPTCVVHHGAWDLWLWEDVMQLSLWTPSLVEKTCIPSRKEK